jgi:hypothetical protein
MKDNLKRIKIAAIAFMFCLFAINWLIPESEADAGQKGAKTQKKQTPGQTRRCRGFAKSGTNAGRSCIKQK